MRHLYKLASGFCVAALGLLALTGCEGGDLYNIDNPDWIAEKIDSINASKSNSQEEEVLEGMMEDVYTIGNTDFSSGFWTAWSKYYVIPDGTKWNAQFNLNINPGDNTYYKNFALVVTNDVDRGGGGYAEYGAYRFDATADSAAYNSQWGTDLYFKFTESTLMLSPTDNQDANVQKLGGKVTLTVDRSQEGKFIIKIKNASATKTYTQPYALRNLNEDQTNTNIRCFLVPEGSYIDFLATNIEPIGGCTSAMDKNPVSMVLNNVPDEVEIGVDLATAMENVTADVTFEEGVTKIVPAAELMFTAIPDMDVAGEKTLVAIYNKTFKGENCDNPIVASAKFNVVNPIASIEMISAPAHSQYYYYDCAAMGEIADRTLAFDATGMEILATYVDGTTAIMNNEKLNFTPIPAQAGSHEVTVSTNNGKTLTTVVTVAKSNATQVHPTPSVLGPEDNTGGFWSALTDNILIPAGETYSVKFKNYTTMANNWNNFVVILRSATDQPEYGVVRADNYGWGNGYGTCRTSAGQDWATWLAAMNGADCECFVTNCGNGTADIQITMKGTDGVTYIQYYLGISTVNVDDLALAFTIDGCHLVFE